MREYIFRGKRVDNSDWIEGSYYNQTHYYGDCCERHYIIASKESLDYDQMLEYYEIYPETVGQYVGLCDKNGNKIWEGDILVESKKRGGFDEWCYRYEVVYTSDDVGSCGCCVPEFSGIGFVFQGITERFRGDFDELEIIGNVHDNPELIEVEE